MRKESLVKLKANNYEKIGSEIEKLVRQENHLLDSPYTDTISISFIGALVKENENSISNFTIDIDDETLKYHLQMILNRYRSLIENIINKYSAEQLKSVVVFYEDMDNRTGIVRTPADVSKLSFKILDIVEDETVADFGSGYADFLINSYMLQDKAKYAGYDINVICNTIAKMKFYLLNLKGVIEQKDILKIEGDLKFNKIFSNPPFGLRVKPNYKKVEDIYPEGIKRISNIEWAFAIKAIESLKDEGKAIVLMSQRALINSIDTEIRKYFIENGFIEAIISLPERIFFETGIKTSLVVLSRDNSKIRLVDATDNFTSDRFINTLDDKNIKDILDKLEKDNDKSTEISIDKFQNFRYQLEPDRFLNVIEAKNAVELGKFAESINRGLHLSRKQLEEITVEYETNTRFINLKDIDDGQISDTISYIDRKLIDNEKVFKNPLRNGDLLLSRTGSPLKIAIVENVKDEKIYYSENLYCIRFDQKKINPYYVKAFFESIEGQKVLQSISLGTAIPMISLRDLKNIKIPYIDLEKQNKFVKDYISRRREIDRRKIEIEEMEEQLIKSVDAFFEEVMQCD